MKNLDLVSQIDWSRLATWIDSEGCIQITWIMKSDRPKGYHALFIDIGNIDPRLMSWLESTFGGYSNPTKSRNTTRQMFYWRVSTKYAEDILRRCLPYMIVKRD